ncbi:hypothetical protein [Flagellimonas flava]|uniref:Uncharacterized protein n=1 Tax=Flagellimonas flava TaxID=570519 RepID=A0A1M5LXK3_9FLAO|nr:hypothetical protein [Allomuricauda flava]SHG69123.1 hypothetical protein SAMN04488116_2116 [Allomuricauda flava]
MYDERSNDVGFEYSGKHWGQSDYPDFKETFKKSIEDLDRHTSMDLVYLNGNILPTGDLTVAKVRIKKIRWHFGFSRMIMEVDLLYDVEGVTVSITGKNKVQVVATKEGNLFKSLKHGHYLFLSNLCER